jgi:hypothetical protein
MPLGQARRGGAVLVTVDLVVSGCATEADLRNVGGALRCIRGVASAEPAADGGHVTVAYDADKVIPVQLERAVRAMGGCLDRIELHGNSPRADTGPRG